MKFCNVYGVIYLDMLGFTRPARKTYTWIRKQMKVYNIIKRVKALKWKWAGYMARRTDGRGTKAVIEWIPLDKKHPRKRSKTRWINDLSKYYGPSWQKEAQDCIDWKHAEEAFLLQWTDNG